MDDDETAPAAPAPQPVAPYTPEDSAYAAIVSQYLGLRRHGADPLGAALITGKAPGKPRRSGRGGMALPGIFLV